MKKRKAKTKRKSIINKIGKDVYKLRKIKKKKNK